ncbi:kallikrein-7-like [Lycorma delicatula]|uniref:kallikrein-7-like n=1 Tax=Lycorma delicatula TaxID=130591 RepID=UPI003F510722
MDYLKSVFYLLIIYSDTVTTMEIAQEEKKQVEVGDIHHFNMTPITGRGKPYDFMDLQKPKFLGSKPIDIVHFPFTVSILRLGQMIGVGVLVSDFWVLTTGYNGEYGEKVQLTIRAGSNSPYVFGQTRFVVRKEIYPLYNNTWANNLALLKLDRQLESARNIVYGEIGEFLPPPYQPMTVVGWGTNGKHSQTLLEKLTVYYTEHDACVDMYFDAEDMIYSVFCVPDTTEGPCHYNFGAPLVDQDYNVVGMYMGTHKCNSEQSYGAYIDVTCYRKWIRRTTIVPEGVISDMVYSFNTEERKRVETYQRKKTKRREKIEREISRQKAMGLYSNDDYYEEGESFLNEKGLGVNNFHIFEEGSNLNSRTDNIL